MDPDLEVSISRTGNIPIVALSGDIDTYTCAKLREAIVDLINEGDLRVVINMSNVNYIDSSGLGTLVGGLRRVNEKNGELAISSATPQLLKVFNITGLSRVFDIFENEGDAVRSLED